MGRPVLTHSLCDVETVVDEGSQAEEGGADLEEEGSRVAALGEAVVLRDLLLFGVERNDHDEMPVRSLERIFGLTTGLSSMYSIFLKNKILLLLIE